MSDSTQRIATALRFIAAAYPERIRTASRIQLSASMHTGMDIREFGMYWGSRNPLVPPGDNDGSKVECDGLFQFSLSDAVFVHYVAEGQCVRDGEFRDFLNAARLHPQWSDADLAKELGRRGAAYGPDARQRLTDRIPPTWVLADLAGELLNIREVEFEMAARDPDGTHFRVDAAWSVTYAVVGKPEVKIVAELEPFGGAVKAVHRVPAPE